MFESNIKLPLEIRKTVEGTEKELGSPEKYEKCNALIEIETY